MAAVRVYDNIAEARATAREALRRFLLVPLLDPTGGVVWQVESRVAQGGAPVKLPRGAEFNVLQADREWLTVESQ